MFITQKRFDEVLELHSLWLENKKRGERANLSHVSLRNKNLNNVNLKEAILTGVSFSESSLRGANLSGSDLRIADLEYADLSGADLSGADLMNANLKNANLSNVNLRSANLTATDLCRSNLSGADFLNANLDFSALPLNCEILEANFNDKQLIQIAYHLVGAGLNSANASERIKKELSKLLDVANEFHRIGEDYKKINK